MRVSNKSPMGCKNIARNVYDVFIFDHQCIMKVPRTIREMIYLRGSPSCSLFPCGNNSKCSAINVTVSESLFRSGDHTMWSVQRSLAKWRSGQRASLIYPRRAWTAQGDEMTNSHVQNVNCEFKVKDSVLQIIDKFIYLRALVTDNGSKSEVLSRIAKAQSSLSKLKTIWKDKNISVSSKIRLLRSLVISIFLYACESWTLDSYLQQRIASFEMRCYRQLLGIDYRQHISNVSVRKMITSEIGKH